MHKIAIKKEQTKYYYYIIPLILIINIVYQSIILKCTSPDSYAYFGISKDFPKINESLFPIGYPVFLKFFNFLINDYFITSKLCSIIVIVFILSFTRIKQFYWREIWIMLTFSNFLKLMPWSWSEILLLPLIILFTYINYLFFSNKIKNKNYIIYNSLIMLLMFMIKYSSIFLCIGSAFFLIIIFFKLKQKLKPYFFSLLISFFLIVTYLSINYYCTGYIMGQRMLPDESRNIRLSVFNIIYTLNPISFQDPIGSNINFFGFYINYIVIAIINIIGLFFLFYTIYNKYLNKSNYLFLLFIAINIIFYYIFLMISYLTTKIDILNFRLLMPGYCLFFIGVFSTNIFKNNEFVLISLSVLSLINPLFIILF